MRPSGVDAAICLWKSEPKIPVEVRPSVSTMPGLSELPRTLLWAKFLRERFGDLHLPRLWWHGRWRLCYVCVPSRARPTLDRMMEGNSSIVAAFVGTLEARH